MEETNEKNIDIKQLLSTKSIYQIRKIFNPTALYYKQHLFIDSRYRDRTMNSNASEYVFDYSNNANLSRGVNSIGDIKNIVSMRIYQFKIPVRDTYTKTDYRKIGMLIKEFSSQAITSRNNTKFHFLIRPIVTNLSVGYPNKYSYDTYMENDDEATFNFQEPIKTFSQITLSFTDPINVIKLYKDYAVCFVRIYGATTEVHTIDCLYSEEINTNIVALPMYITMKEFTTATPIADAAVITQMNTDVPYKITPGTVLNGNMVFIIPVNTSAVDDLFNLRFLIFFEDRRILIPIEFTCIQDK